jgi:galactokinase/mevalonate kinase-like predicted kinase
MGGLDYIRFNDDGTVFVDPIELPAAACTALENNLLLLYTVWCARPSPC